MDICLAYQVLNKDLVRVAKSLVVIQEVEAAEKVNTVRLEESSYILSEDTVRFSQVVSAHNLHQYKNRFHSITLKEGVTSWLNILLSIDKGGTHDVT